MNRYQVCRWYDVYPRLAFLLKLVRILPLDQQQAIGTQLNTYLDCRFIPAALPLPETIPANRWYDASECFRDSLERLKLAPLPVKQQATDYLHRLLNVPATVSNCA